MRLSDHIRPGETPPAPPAGAIRVPAAHRIDVTRGPCDACGWRSELTRHDGYRGLLCGVCLAGVEQAAAALVPPPPPPPPLPTMREALRACERAYRAWRVTPSAEAFSALISAIEMRQSLAQGE